MRKKVGKVVMNIHGVPVIAALIRLCVGLGGANGRGVEMLSSCSWSRVLLYLMTLG